MPPSPLRSRLHLIGGGPGTMLSLRRHLKSVFSDVEGPKKPLVAYVGAASADNAGFQTMIGAVIAAAGGRVKAAKLASPRAKVSAAQSLLEDSDVVFVSGGDVDAGMHVLEDRGVLPLFYALAQGGKPIIGISAGAIMLSRAWVRFPEDAPEPSAHAPTVFPCLGLAPIFVDAHAEDDDWGELRVLLGLISDQGEARPLGFGLTRKGGVTVEPSEDGTKVTAFGTAAPRFVAKKNKVIEAAPLELGDSESVHGPEPSPRRGARAR